MKSSFRGSGTQGEKKYHGSREGGEDGVVRELKTKRKWVDGKWIRPEEQRTARSIIGVGEKVEIWFEEDDLRDAWFPATVIEELGNNRFLIEYQCDKADLRKVTVDRHHIRPATPPIKDTNFVLLEKEREVSHLELRLHVEHGESSSVKRSSEERSAVLLNVTGPIDKQTSIVASTMKRTKVTSAGSNDKHLRPSKKLKPGITFDDQTLSDVGGGSKEANNPTATATATATENLSRGKRVLVNREKNIESSSPVITSARKKGRSAAADSKGVKALPQGEMKIQTPKIVEKEHVPREFGPPITCVMGLQCKAMTISQTKNVKKTVESGVPLTPKTTGSQEEKAADGGVSLKRKRGRPFKSQPKTPLAVTHANGDAGQQRNTPVVNNAEKLPNTSVKYQSVKGKRGKRRKIKSINIVSPAQAQVGKDSSSKQKAKENGGSGSEVVVEKSADRMSMSISISDDQPLSRWIEGMQQQPSASVKKQIEKLSFEKRSTLWATLESMELFRMIPQKPHFRPLEKEKECTREGHAISKMVNYLRVVEAASQMKLESPRSAYDDNMEALLELESHGFDVKAVRERLRGLLRIKEKQEGLEEESKKVKEKMEAERVEGVRIDKEIELVDKQVVALLEKRVQVLKKKEKKDAQVGVLEAEVDGIRQGIDQARRNFDDLAAASLCVSSVSQQA
ncbi:unnamed protein product [Lactuca saligna]|uniref:Agenet domain-containing protein n=1 Tax=Lactuca saligna TaxID=75948 RepID=A0AA35ZWZ2_LACSI|nr:unnamed protein product [Lactuca saligna]